MYWKFNQSTSPHIDVLLNNKDVSVYELLDEEDVIQECKIQNKKLIEFLSRPSVMEELISLTLDPPDNVEERSRYKYPNIACELLTCDVPAINERIAGNETLLEKLYSFLERDAPLNPLLASFFSKLLSVLITRKAEQNWYSYQFTCLQVLEFLKSKENCVDLLLKHLGTSAIMDLVLKLITQIEGVQMKQNILTWLNDQNLVQNLVALLDPSVDSDRHGNASQLLCDVIKMLRENQMSTTDRASFDPILDAIESPDTVTQLLDHMLGPEKCETAIVGGISVLLALLDQGKESPNVNATFAVMSTSGDDTLCSDSERTSKVILSTTNTIIPRLKDFHNLLLDPPHKPSIKTTAGVLDPPVGITRLQVAKLLAAMVGTNNVAVNKEITELGTVEVLLDLFFKYTWNNFLHTQVEKCIAFALNSELTCTNSDDSQTYVLLSHVFIQCKLLQRILDAWEDNDTKQSKPGGVRCGYMGHLIKIANHIAQHGEKEPFASLLKQYVSPDIIAAWEKFVAGALADINQTHRTCMGGSHPGQSSSEDSNSEYPDIPFAQGMGFRQTFPDYEIPQVASQFIENYSFQDDEFAAIEDANQLKDDIDQQEDIFGKLCAQKTQTLEKTDDEVWDDQEQELNFQSVIDSKASTWQNEDEGTGNSSDEEERGTIDGTEILHMEIDSTDPWDVAHIKESSHDATFIEDIATVPEDSVFFKDIAPVEDAENPWGNSGNSGNSGGVAVADQGWADFGSAGFADFETNFGTSEVNEGHKFESGMQKTDEDGGNTHKSESVTDLADKLGAMGINKLNEHLNALETNACEPTGSLPKSDDNANCSSSLENDAQLLMDNYRYIFLSAQGLMTLPSACDSSDCNSSSAGNENTSTIVNNSASSSKQTEEQQQHVLLPNTELLVAENGPIDPNIPVEVEVAAALPMPKLSDTSPPAENPKTSNGPV
ncbi:serine/threonine-protein phosphatase 6 regulatory subunit 3 isoform X1 [Schistocerca cancellata]|uniref:serine/threonine-protein phosphatase 6 regulatory subunit 3 isoform X1 n=1 Tax=Schistocerca cancellata TaxID=274614 RepID=UPI002119557E|nr:serine/threonine-protein phosphatase 6 regulatory subunit 3 isoform X1 [Schistocerca cancellata]XP_049763176.1 serine/threonine-protein phosphatase 6 regulatory subunit 3 isoform X1 [Schistocerca cancellata]